VSQSLFRRTLFLGVASVLILTAVCLPSSAQVTAAIDAAPRRAMGNGDITALLVFS